MLCPHTAPAGDELTVPSKLYTERMKQSPDYQSLARLAVIQHLRSYGIKIKHWNCKQRPEAARSQPSGKVFGTALHSLPQVYVRDYGAIPSFLVDICKYLELHAHTEGLFRKSGSVMRQKLLKTKLDSGENGLSDAPPCDVAGILKQFFRELPEPILPTDVQDALCKAQHLTSNEERTSATLLISCLVPERSVIILRYIFHFLHTVSMRSDVNKMDSNNLAVVFAPNLLQLNDDHEKMSANTEKKLRAHTEVVRTLIDHSADIGSVPQFLLEKIPGMLGVDAGTPGPEASEDGEVDPVAEKKRRRRSVGDYVSGALNKLITNRTPSSTPQSERNVLGSMVTPLILTPSTKRKLPVDSVQGFSTKKRKSIKNSLAFDLLPNSLFGSGSTPASAGFESPHASFDSSQSSLSPLVSSSRHLSSSCVLRRSKRCENRKVQRMDSGKTGCFSPKISRKEMVRRSLRLRFSLGKSSKDVSTLGGSTNTQSQNIGWRLANSQELTPVATSSKVETLSFPLESPFVSAGSKHISKSEENLLSPPLPESDHRRSWTGPQAFKLEDTREEGTPVAGHLWAAHGFSEPVLCGKPPAMPKVPRSLTIVYNQDQNKNDSLCQEEMNLADNTVMRVTQAFTDFGTDLHTVMAGASFAVDKVSDLEDVDVSPHKHLEDEESTRALIVACVSGEDTVVQEKGKDENDKRVVISPAKCCDNDLIEEPVESVTEEHFFVTDTSFRDSEPCEKLYIEEIVLDVPHEAGDTLSCSSAKVDSIELQEDMAVPCQEKESFHSDAATSSSAQECCLTSRKSSRVSDHIQHFNKLCLSDRKSSQKPKSPIKLQRTPVRQSVRRINSLSEMAKQGNGSGKRQSTTSLPMKSVSFDGSRSSDLSCVHPGNTLLSQSPEASVSNEQVTTVDVRSRPAREQSIKHRGHTVPNPTKSVLEDVTNQEISKNISKRPALSGRVAKNCAVLATTGREHHRYKGSPRNPIGRVNFLPSSKPLEL